MIGDVLFFAAAVAIVAAGLAYAFGYYTGFSKGVQHLSRALREQRVEFGRALDHGYEDPVE